jgi:signal transduction histidine kinase/ActR/RegA family two-component response regulator
MPNATVVERERSLSEAILGERIDALFRFNNYSLGVTITVTPAVAYEIAPWAGAWAATIWALVMLLVAALRFGLNKLYLDSGAAQRHRTVWRRAFVVGSVIQGLAWGALALPVITMTPELRLLAYTVLVAITAFALFPCMPYFPAFAALSVSILGCIAVSTQLVPPPLAALTLSLAGVYTVAILLAARRMGVFFGDVTRARLESAELSRAASAANAAKSEFVANMSHEIRTPMNGLLGLAELMLGDNLSAKQRERVELMLASGQQLLAVINDVLDFSKIEAGELRIENVGFDVRELVERATQLHSVVALEKQLDLTVEIDNRLPQRAQGDPLRLWQVLNNLLGNACKFTDAGGITLRARLVSATPSDLALSRRLRFEVEDTGVGLDENQLEELFAPFRQADSSTTRRYGGTGLGLSIAKRLVEAMGGTIGAQGRQGKGALFWFEVPLVEEPQGAQRQRIESTAPPQADLALQGRRILVVEDNPVNLLVADAMLRTLGVDVTTAQDGEAALQCMRLGQFDAVLMDCQMPVMDGYEAVREWRRDERARGPARLPVIALTANALTGDRERCLEAGFDDHLGKPYRREDMEAVLAHWLGDRLAA